MAKHTDDQPYRFSGFSLPTYTQVPDQLFDELLPRLTESELKVLLYIIRRTFGFKKASDDISLKQLVEGITTRDGRRLDHGAGVSKTSAVRGVTGLIEKNIIVAVRNRSKDRGDEPTTYQLKMLGDPVSRSETRVDDPVSRFETPRGVNLDQPRVPDMDTQETVEQQTAEQESSNLRKVPTPIFDEDRDAISSVMRDFARELGDTAPLPSTVSRAYNLYKTAQVDIDTFLDALYEARRITQERTASIRTESPKKLGPKPKVAYFFKVVESLIAS